MESDTLEIRRETCDLIRSAFGIEDSSERCQEHGLAHVVAQKARERGFDKGLVVAFGEYIAPGLGYPRMSSREILAYLNGGFPVFYDI